jgi:large conductance mechanosensitive channel
MAIKQEATGFFKDFQAFITKGNVIDLAVAVIIGGAFNAIVASLTKDLINPILGVLVGKPDFSDLFWVMKLPEGYAGPMTYDALTKAGASVFGYGAFLTAVIQFLLLAFVIFCFLRALTKAKAALERKEEEAKQAAAAAAAAAPAPTPEDIVLLRAILDELKKKQG